MESRAVTQIEDHVASRFLANVKRYNTKVKLTNLHVCVYVVGGR